MSPDELHAWIDEFAGVYGNAPWVWVVGEIAIILAAMWGVISAVIDVWSKLQGGIERFRALFFDAARRQRVEERQRFAGHLETRLKQLNARESWDDNRFAELEAEVEAPTQERALAWLPRVRLPVVKRQRLSRALESSSARLILLQGEPGSGKSVALRHVALSMARRGTKSRSDVSKLPVYINLKLLRPDPTRGVDRNLIEDFVRGQLAGNRDIDAYLDQEFDAGMKAGRWVFLFDSFDEIPDILASADANEVVTKYANAIYEFLHGMNACRGVIASRLFRGPKTLGGTEFRIAPLDRARRIELLERANLEPKSRRALRLWMDGAPGSMQRELASPMFVGMLCAQARGGFVAPRSAHRVYEDYITRLLARDARRLDERFGVQIDQLRAFAEKVAFYMTADGLGLEPRIDVLSSVLVERENLAPADVENDLRALAYVKLAKIDDDDRGQTFTFTHRRFQEFFSTCVLLREPDRVDSRTLLTNAAWRESTVVLLQTSAAETLSPLLEEAGILLRESDELLLEDSIDHSAGFDWPPGARHVCAILQDGLRTRRALLPDEIREYADGLIQSACLDGTHLDHKWALEVAGACSSSYVNDLLTEAFDSGSVLLADAAFWQVHELAEVPDDVVGSVNSRLIEWAKSGVLQRERHKLAAYVARTSIAGEWGASIQLLARMRMVMAALSGALLVVGLVVLGPSVAWLLAALLTVLALVMLWRPLGVMCRAVSVLAWCAVVDFGLMWWLWVGVAILALTWDWAARVVVHLRLSPVWLFRLCPWLVFPMIGAILVSMIEMRALGMALLKIAAALLGLTASIFAIVGVVIALDWIETGLSARAPRMRDFLGLGLKILLYVGGSVLALAVGLFVLVGMWNSVRDYLRFVRAHRTARHSGVVSVEMLRELLAGTDDDRHQVRIIELVRERRSLPATREVIAELRTLERDADEALAEPEVQDAYARLAESLIDRRAGAPIG